MSYWKQEVPFNPKKLGKHFSLRSVRKGYGIKFKHFTAKQAMNENRDKGTLHPMSTIPTNVSVPVFCSAGLVGKMMVNDKGKYYYKARKTMRPTSNFMWGEWLNGKKVVSWVDIDKLPKKSPIKFADTVYVSGRGYETSKGKGMKTKAYSNRKMLVVAISDGRYGCNEYNRMGAVTGWFTPSQVRKDQDEDRKKDN